MSDKNQLISLEHLQLAFGLDPLLDDVQLQIFSNERICLIGRNGAGKSSLLKIVEGVLLCDRGTIWRKPGLKIARLEQELPRDLNISTYEFVAQGLAEIGDLLAEYHSLTQHLNEKNFSAFEKVQYQIDVLNGWQFEQRINTTLQQLDLSPDTMIANLSGGWQRRAALARTLVALPDVLLLDEPTNHLDIAAIQWLEDFLLSCKISLLFITHDRALLQRLATRIIELDRGKLTSWPGDYQQYLIHKEEMLHAEEKQAADFDKKLAQEEIWIRQGIKARRTRNEGRVRALKAMRKERAQRRSLGPKASFDINTGNQSGQLVVEASHVSYVTDAKPLIKNFSIRIMRGDKIGLIGPNGVGKTTLLNILLGQIPPQQGEIKIGTNLQIAYFDQLRMGLDMEKTVAENVSPGKDTIEVNGKNKHIISYLNDFLFTPQRAMTPVKALSGGECNRLLLAKLFSRPANLLVMDEPTNDLDIETLDLLEELLMQFNGTLLLVSHDRDFIDNVVTSTLVFEGNGKITEFVGGYREWQEQVVATAVKKEVKLTREKIPTNPSKKLSFKEQQQLQELPNKIEQLENNIQELHTLMQSPEFYKNDQTFITSKLNALKTAELELQNAYQCWEALEEKRQL